MRRLLTIVFAYIFASAVGGLTLTFGTILWAIILSGSYAARDVAWVLPISFLFAFFFGWIVAVPLAVFSEVQNWFGSLWVWDWKIYTVAGFFLGLGLMVFLASSHLQVWPVVLPATTLAGYAYWIFAWRWLPPPANKSN